MVDFFHFSSASHSFTTSIPDGSAALTGQNIIEAETAEVFVVVEYDGGTITNEEIAPEYEKALADYAMLGEDVSEISDAILSQVLVDMASQRIAYLKAAELGSAFAQYIVGNNYFNGVGVEENTDEAFKWFFKAAEQGQPNAQFEIGQLYEYGGHDIETAREWYRKAAEQGHSDAQQKLREL